MRNRIIALALPRENPWNMAMASFANSLRALAHLLYGSEQRTNRTLAFALGLAMLGMLIGPAGAHAQQVCVY